MNILKQIGFFLWSALIFIAGLFTYAKLLDKPESVVNNEYGRIKNKGKNNDISTSSTTNVDQDNKQVKKKLISKLFKKKNK